MIRTLIVDDEPLARERLAQLLSHSSDIQLLGECGDGKEAVRLIREQSPDLVLLDIQLPELDGFEVIAALPPGQAPAVLFVTAYDRFAIQAFEVHAVDYLLKPVESERLTQALVHVRKQLLGKEFDRCNGVKGLIESLQTHRAHPSRMLLKLDNEIVCLNPSEIDWIESAGNYACFHIGPHTRILRETMNSVESRLVDHNFVRIHRTTIVNIARIRRLRPLLYGDYEIELSDGTELPMSRTYRRAVLAKLKSIGAGSSAHASPTI